MFSQVLAQAQELAAAPPTGTTHWTRIDAGYENLRINMHTLFNDPGICPAPAAA